MKNTLLLLLLFLFKISDAQTKLPNTAVSILSIPNVGALKEIFGKENVIKVDSEIVEGDYTTTEHVVYKGTLNEFSVLGDNELYALVLPASYKGNFIETKLLPGMSVDDLAKINGDKFSFNSYKKGLQWYDGSFSRAEGCYDISFQDDSALVAFVMEASEKFGGWNVEIFYNDPIVKKYNIRVGRVIFYRCDTIKAIMKEQAQESDL